MCLLCVTDLARSAIASQGQGHQETSNVCDSAGGLLCWKRYYPLPSPSYSVNDHTSIELQQEKRLLSQDVQTHHSDSEDEQCCQSSACLAAHCQSQDQERVTSATDNGCRVLCNQKHSTSPASSGHLAYLQDEEQEAESCFDLCRRELKGLECVKSSASLVSYSPALSSHPVCTAFQTTNSSQAAQSWNSVSGSRRTQQNIDANAAPGRQVGDKEQKLDSCVKELKAFIQEFRNFSEHQVRPDGKEDVQWSALSCGSASPTGPPAISEGKVQSLRKTISQGSLPGKVKDEGLLDPLNSGGLHMEAGIAGDDYEHQTITSPESGEKDLSWNQTVTRQELQQNEKLLSCTYWAEPEGIKVYETEDVASAPSSPVSPASAEPDAVATVQHPSISVDPVMASSDAAKFEILRILPHEFKVKVNDAILARVQSFDNDKNRLRIARHSFPQSVRVAAMKRTLNSTLSCLGYQGYFSETSVPVEYEHRWFEACGEFFNTAMLIFGDVEKEPAVVSMSNKMLFETERLSRDLVAIASFQDLASQAVHIASLKLDSQGQEPINPTDVRAMQTISRAMLKASSAAAGVSMALTANLELSRRQGLLEKFSLATESKKWLRSIPLGEPEQFNQHLGFLKELRATQTASTRQQ